MQKFFNTAGPQKAHINYTLDPLNRLDWADIQQQQRQRRRKPSVYLQRLWR